MGGEDDTKRICADCGAEEALPGIDVGPICLDQLRKSGDEADKSRAEDYSRALGGDSDPGVVIGDEGEEP